MFSKACKYGIKATLYIAGQTRQGSRASLKEISGAIDSPQAFTSKILQQLVKAGVIESVKGATGGFEMDKNRLKKTRLNHIVQAIDGDQIYTGCGLGFKQCSESRPCPMHFKFKKIRVKLEKMLMDTPISELSENLENGKAFLK